MNRRIAYPFLILPDGCVNAEPWLITVDGRTVNEDEDIIEDWDYSSTVTIERSIAVDYQKSADCLGIELEDLTLDVVFCVGTGAGRLPRTTIYSSKQILSCDDPVCKVVADLSSASMSSYLEFQTHIVLAASPTHYGNLSPKRRSDRLWNDRCRMKLEGEEPRFPVEVADFGRCFGNRVHSKAPWYLVWSPSDWTKDFHGAIRLYLNSNKPEFVRLMESQDPLVLQIVLADVMSQLCQRLISDHDAAEVIATAESTTVAGQAVRWLQMAWPDLNLERMRSILENKPVEFRATLLALAEIGDE